MTVLCLVKIYLVVWQAGPSHAIDQLKENENSFSNQDVFDGRYSDMSLPDEPVKELASSSESDLVEVTKPSSSVEPVLREWAIEKNVSLTTLSLLCKGLKERRPCFDSLPSDGRTVLKTHTNLQVKSFPPSQYIHIGLKKLLQRIVSNLKSSSLTYETIDHFFQY